MTRTFYFLYINYLYLVRIAVVIAPNNLFQHTYQCIAKPGTADVANTTICGNNFRSMFLGVFFYPESKSDIPNLT